MTPGTNDLGTNDLGTNESGTINLETLQQQFGIPGVLRFDENDGLIQCHVTGQQASASIYVQGAHLSAWQPKGTDGVIFFSRKSEMAPGKAFRGGIPIVFPWFANDKKQDRIDGHPGPSHGFARIQDWTLAAATHEAGVVRMTFTLGPTEISRSMGYDSFELTLVFTIGRTLQVRLTVANRGNEELSFEQAFHTYLHVSDVHEVSITGLEPTAYVDKTDSFKLKPAAHEPITFMGPTDRIYQDTTAECRVRDGAGRRTIAVRKTGSETTVVWNPGKALADVGEWDWHNFVCVETANVDARTIRLKPGASASVEAVYSVTAKA